MIGDRQWIAPFEGGPLDHSTVKEAHILFSGGLPRRRGNYVLDSRRNGRYTKACALAGDSDIRWRG